MPAMPVCQEGTPLRMTSPAATTPRLRGRVGAALAAALTAGGVALAACTSAGTAPGPTVSTPAALSSADAEALATRTATELTTLLAAASASLQTGAAGADARAAAFVGPAAQEATAVATQWPVLTAAERRAEVFADAAPRILAVSRPDAAQRFVLAATTRPDSQGTVLVYASSETPSAPLKIAATAAMLQGGSVSLPKALIGGAVPTSVAPSGSASAGPGSTDPMAALTAWAGRMAYPHAIETDLYADDPFTAKVIATLAAQATTIGAAGQVTSTPGEGQVLLALPLTGDEGTLVLGTVLRSEAITLAAPGQLNQSPAVQALSGLATLTTASQSTIRQTVLLRIPAQGRVDVLAASEQRVAATGS